MVGYKQNVSTKNLFLQF